jgi:hypothetical protein
MSEITGILSDYEQTETVESVDQPEVHPEREPHPETQPIFDDIAWINDQYNDGSLDEYSGEYIGVVDKRLIAHGPIVQRVREEAAAVLGCRIGRVVTRFVDRNMYW